MAASLSTRSQRLVYLLTYSRADLERFDSRQSFASAVLDTWGTVTNSTIDHYVVCREKHAAHAQVENSNQYHYHMAIKLSRKSRWKAVRLALAQRFGIQVNFSGHRNYYDAYSYCVKEDNEVFLSPGHPSVDEMPRTTAATSTRINAAIEHRRGSQNEGKKKKRRRMLTVYEVTHIIRANNLYTRLALMAFAAAQEREGKTDLAQFIANRGSRVVNEALAIAEELKDAEEKQARLSKTRIELLQDQLQNDCVVGCNKRWLNAALQILERNEIDVSSYANALYRALHLGRGKYTNVYIYGPANSGKSFMIAPLKIVYHAFVNPATGGFAWVGAEEAEVIVLNDLRWTPSLIAWGDFLQMLEGDTMHLPAPKSFVQQDIVFSKDTPFFATADAPLVLLRGGAIDRVNTEMMRVRWRYFEFWRQIPEEVQMQLQPCGRCFAELILLFKDQE